MNSRQRVGKAVNFEEPDRVPIDLGAMRASGINAVVYDQLKSRMGIHTPTKLCDSMQILAEVELEVVDRLHVDVVPLEPAAARWAEQEAREGVEKTLFCGQKVHFPPGTFITEDKDGSWLLGREGAGPYARMPRDGY